MDENRRDESQPQKSLIFTAKDDRPKTKTREYSHNYLVFGPLFILQNDNPKLHDALRCVTNPASHFKCVALKKV